MEIAFPMTMKYPFVEDTLGKKVAIGTGLSVDCTTWRRHVVSQRAGAGPSAGVTIDVADKQLKAKTVGTPSASTYLCYIEKTYPTAKAVTYPNADALYLDLTSGRLDAIFADAVASDFSLLKTDAARTWRSRPIS
ncbi:hypothetical protein ASD99_07780 [Mesorhizobium sp. Root695]|nr:hypothetical protein ASD99_07780 [Mesorhizobium sp. Root695]